MPIFMRFISLLAIGLALSATSMAATHQALPAYLSDQVIVGFHPGTRGQAMAEAHRQAGAQALTSIEQINAQVVGVPAGGVMGAIAKYTKNPNVRYAEPNYVRPMILPDEGNDPPPPVGLGLDYVAEQWYLNNPAIPPSSSRCWIQVSTAFTPTWRVSVSSRSISVPASMPTTSSGTAHTSQAPLLRQRTTQLASRVSAGTPPSPRSRYVTSTSTHYLVW
jgi:hypothetical protein